MKSNRPNKTPNPPVPPANQLDRYIQMFEISFFPILIFTDILSVFPSTVCITIFGATKDKINANFCTTEETAQEVKSCETTESTLPPE